MSADTIDIRYVAKLARIALTDEEVERFGQQLGDLLGHVNALAELDIASVPATAQVVESRNVMRDDDAAAVPRSRARLGAKRRSGRAPFFRVPRIIAE